MWFPVKGYEGLYEVSRDGRIRAIRQHGRFRSPMGARAELRPFFLKNKASSKPYVNLYRDGDMQRRAMSTVISQSIPAQSEALP